MKHNIPEQYQDYSCVSPMRLDYHIPQTAGEKAACARLRQNRVLRSSLMFGGCVAIKVIYALTAENKGTDPVTLFFLELMFGLAIIFLLVQLVRKVTREMLITKTMLIDLKTQYHPMRRFRRTSYHVAAIQEEKKFRIEDFTISFLEAGYYRYAGTMYIIDDGESYNGIIS